MYKMETTSIIKIVKTDLVYYNNFLREFEVYLDGERVCIFRTREEQTYLYHFHIIEGVVNVNTNKKAIYIYTPGTHQATIYDNYDPRKKYKLIFYDNVAMP